MSIPFSYQELEQIYAKSIGNGARSIAVTSSKPQEGTSSVVCSLAERAKAVGYKVLVVDLNLNHPSVTSMLSLAKQQTVNSVDDYWTSGSQQNQEPLCLTDGLGLSVIPAPVEPTNQQCAKDDYACQQKHHMQQLRIREQSHLSSLISLWHQRHDVIIFDTSPLCLVNKNNIPAQTVASCCDGTLLIVQTGTTKANDLFDAMTTLRSQNINLLGTVVNENKTPLLGHELARQCQKLEHLLPSLAAGLQKFVSSNPFLQRQF